ncbi:glutathione S-transferase [Thiohalobacter thiocyanaticus]|uniref:Glutathione S-transferase n=1 Tax=Thiohalobacter thiocyanaticus TaxID=585455 RepID=A0A1Z4VN54_9GAMM|nr:glutathione S-transferase family protein [Thiohalobacter thiocyanaticus]BAZ92778.1 glutathione S-transferase [Thiohalobacter thiocyanaticus]
MSLMVNGELREGWFDSEQEDGEFVRRESQFRSWVTPDGSPGPGGEGGFRAEPGRYHLYVSYACPWAHRTLILRRLKRLDAVISVDVVHPHMGEPGWHFDASFPGATADTVNGCDYMHELYRLAQPDYTGIVTVPVLWDRERRTIVNNESAEIIRMLNSAFDAWGDAQLDMYPVGLRDEIDAINAFVYENINNGVYRTGFATSQAAYDRAFDALFAALDEIEVRLSRQRYLVGGRLTEADWRLFTTLVRFDAVYVGHFKCNRNRIADFPALSNYLRELYQYPGIAQTVNLEHIKAHYYWSHPWLNPSRIVPGGPRLDLAAAHDRDRYPAQP